MPQHPFRTLWLATLLASTAGLMLGAVPPASNVSLTPLRPHGPGAAKLFSTVTPEACGISTTNRYADPRMWGERYHEFEIGAIGTGVAIGDYDNDGLPDVFIVSKTETCHLFRNLGNFTFQDVTEAAGVADKGEAALVWKQGASFVDINNDGLLDLYLCRFNAPNLLYLNQGNGTFKESAHALGLDLVDASVMAAFCDYDRDGRLDVFVQTNLLNHREHPTGQPNHLFHQEVDGTFREVTAPAGISGIAQGHSAVWCDFDRDGWPDLYVANDFQAPDQWWHNEHNGTFKNVISQRVPRMPYSAMGCDFSDINNDGYPDLLVCDMAATTHEKDQRGMAESRARARAEVLDAEETPQSPRNALYLGTGTGHYLETSFLAGISATDWTWSPRFEDLDNDGYVDLFVTNGMHRESTNVDLLMRQQSSESTEERLRVMRESPPLVEANLAYQNQGDGTFREVGLAWGLDERGVSFGSALGDLDGDGDLDIIYTNYQKGATVLRNDSTNGHRLVVELRGTKSNRYGVGAVVEIETKAGKQVRELSLARGLLSQSEPLLHFGLGEAQQVDRLTVTWPSGTVQVLDSVPADNRVRIEEATTSNAEKPTSRTLPLYRDATALLGNGHTVEEDPIDESSLQHLVPFRFQNAGPFLAQGDFDGDGKPDFFVSGSGRVSPTLYFGTADGHFAEVSLGRTAVSGGAPDGPVAVLDVNDDGLPDLVITKSGAGFLEDSEELQPEVWLNRGGRRFEKAASDFLPNLKLSAGAIAALQTPRETELFIGGRVLPGSYPSSPRSALLRRTPDGWKDVTEAEAPELLHAGMVTSALWADVDGDGTADLVLACDWGNVRVFKHRAGGPLTEATTELGFDGAGKGFWSALAAADLNGDGKPDFVLGNLGLNTPYRADPQHPSLLFAGDFRGAGEDTQLVEGCYEGDVLYPRRSRKELLSVLPALGKKFPKNNSYAKATLEEVLGRKALETAERFEVTELNSGVLLSGKDGKWHFAALPKLAQVAPIQDLVLFDWNHDGKLDLFATQNTYAPVASLGRFDGGLSLLFEGTGTGNFVVVPADRSGLALRGDTKHACVLPGETFPLVVTRNKAPLSLFLKN